MLDRGPLLTIAELADRLGRSQTTVRNWQRAFRDLAGDAVGADRVRRYPLGLFERLAVLYDQGLPTRAIRAELERQQDGDPVPATHDDLILDELRSIRAAVERIADHLDRRRGA